MIPCLFSPITPSKSSLLFFNALFLLATSFDFLPFSPMESFAFLKFWKTSNARVAGYGDPLPVDKCLLSVVEDEEDDSFFELELALPDYHRQSGFKEDKTSQNIRRIGDFISEDKSDARISSKPQSPISILRQSAPKLRVFMFGSLIKKSRPEKDSQSQKSISAESNPKVDFTVNLRVEDKLHRSHSSKRNSNGGVDREVDGSSRRFSKDSLYKYLNLIKKPLYVKFSSTGSNSKRSTDQREPFDSPSTASFTSPRKSEDRVRFRPPCNSLGKSRSAGALLVGASSPSVCKDDSLTQLNDGIQGAILHCKQSFNSERRVMSRCGSDTSHDKSSQRSDELKFRKDDEKANVSA